MQTILIAISTIAVLCILTLIIDMVAKGFWISGYFKLGFILYHQKVSPVEGDFKSILKSIGDLANTDRYRREILFHQKNTQFCLFREKMVSWGHRFGFAVSYLPLMLGILQYNSADKSVDVRGHIAIGWPLSLLLMLIMIVLVFGFANGNSGVVPALIIGSLAFIIIGFGFGFLMYRIQKKRYNLIVKQLKELTGNTGK